MINQYKPFNKEEENEFINNWFFGLDAYKDFCASFECGNHILELRIYPNKTNFSVLLVYGDFLNNVKRKKTLFKGDKIECEVKIKEFVKCFNPEYYLNKLGVLNE